MALTTRFRRVWYRTPLDHILLLIIIGCCLFLFFIQSPGEHKEDVETSNIQVPVLPWNPQNFNLKHRHRQTVNPSYFLAPIKILYPSKPSSKSPNQKRTGEFICDYSNSSGNGPNGFVSDTWKQINAQNDTYKLLVYSAYWDERVHPAVVRVIAVTIRTPEQIVYCRLKFQDGTCHDVKAIVQIMTEHWKLKYASFFISCPVPSTYQVPFKVALSTFKSNLNNAFDIPVHWNRQDNSSARGQIAVCVKPVHYSYNQGVWFIEFIEMHRLLGVDHFYIYNHTVGPDVQNILLKYVQDGVVSVLPWQLGVTSQKEIRTEGMFAAFNDCLYRTMYLFKYAILVDLDEFIIPRIMPNYLSMLQYLEGQKLKRGMQASNFMVRNAFFYLYWENDTTAYGEKPERPPRNIPYLLTQFKTRRVLETMKYGSRSKLIVIPDRAVEVGNHVVWKNIKGYRTVPVAEEVAILHHYRICEFGGYVCLNKTSIIDHSALRFNSTLLSRVQRQCADIFPESGLCPVAPSLGSPW